MLEVKASLLSTRLLQQFRHRAVGGKVHSCFPNAINIELDEGFLFNIIHERIPPNPRALVVPSARWTAVRQSLFPAGRAVRVDANRLDITSSGLSISFEDSQLWDPSPWLPGPALARRKVLQNLGFLKMIFPRDMAPPRWPNKGPAALSEVFRRSLLAAIVHLQNCIIHGDPEGVSSASRQLLGLGPGLTPSGDDVLSGVMAAAAYCALAHCDLLHPVARVTAAISSEVPGRTTLFSEGLLRDAAEGEVVSPAGEFMRSLLCQEDTTILVNFASRLMEMGHTSGVDMLEGILAGVGAFLTPRDETIGQENDQEELACGVKAF